MSWVVMEEGGEVMVTRQIPMLVRTRMIIFWLLLIIVSIWFYFEFSSAINNGCVGACPRQFYRWWRYSDRLSNAVVDLPLLLNSVLDEDWRCWTLRTLQKKLLDQVSSSLNLRHLALLKICSLPYLCHCLPPCSHFAIYSTKPAPSQWPCRWLARN